jgi:16S rRNA (cytosine967-C5)-methyltransferase
MTETPKTVPQKTPPKNRAAALSPARKAAFDVLQAVEVGQSHSDELLRSRAVNALSLPDRNLATALVLGVLRNQIRLDQQIQAFLQRPNARLDTEIRIALRLGAFQILHMDRIPARAAIDESVELAKRVGQRFASGMVNAVLRKLAAAPRRNYAETTVEELALSQAHPVWMVERWSRIFGLEAAAAVCHHGQVQPMITVRLESPEVEAELTSAGIALEPTELLTSARAVLSGDVTACAAFREGRVRLQDEGSQLVAELAGFNGDSSLQTKNIVDMCAAPGGKTLILAERNPQAHILACESSKTRLAHMKERLAGLGERLECRLLDAATLDEPCVFDLALADVPCSGTGTLGRNPEIRHRLRPDDLARQAERQRAILSAALKAVRPGGRVVYSTCSLEPEENEQVVTAVLGEMPDVRLVSLEKRLDDLLAGGILTVSGAERLSGALTAGGCLRLLPGSFETDGFFVALLERTGQ